MDLELRMTKGLLRDLCGCERQLTGARNAITNSRPTAGMP
jgi:hypothetical protein